MSDRVIARLDTVIQNRQITQSQNRSIFLDFGGQHFADAAHHIALGFAERKEFEAVAQALAVADDGGLSRDRD